MESSKIGVLIFRAINGIAGVILIWSGLYEVISYLTMTGMMGMGMGMMMMGFRLFYYTPIVLPGKYFIPTYFLGMGILLLIFGVYPKLMKSFILNGSKPYWIFLRILMFIGGLTFLLYGINFSHSMIMGMVNPLAPAASIGFPFAGGIMLHLIFEHLYASGFATVVAIYSRILNVLLKPIRITK
ncbi:hypothetical protein BFU36_00400 [Sulfolobus sp. A20]|uniref:hypothetical protein n=1 Tax=Sulfolobaceae TaxID=118883 RepID=UPI000845E1DF|nr:MULTISPECIES: hypothetical protein [unclassified Sulfolobus]TRM76608.1 hypothetical protein DJ523_00810 [Sulfolobus sp. E5]TRM76977.1 hypothetical protein DJ532_06285 [Sulfolobus sp. A20-N-F8]TRM79523.1 hypothetical protein DJ528_00615 [Sulfolobus sp. B5]TRM80710.1 hypothetical protein DJ531_11920 [Sulfolobus sp. A20-N-F6]TRM81984.1 hypothetical protein DJ524_02240 [Sulfolobus sp. D5]TRM85398.1 hypothetical protein DJ522_00880 [Sulfolobus sp. F3]TRM87738.1 hypothetical protein DJ521_03095